MNSPLRNTTESGYKRVIMQNLHGKNALITGASKGLGVYIAHELAKKGMNLVLAARSEKMLVQVKTDVELMGIKAIAIPTDVSNPDALESLVKSAEQALGRIDVLVNNAAIESLADYAVLEPERIEKVIRVNLIAPMQLSRMLMPKMIAQGAGHIVNMVSMAGLGGTPYSETYAASKHGLMGFTRSLRLTIEGEGYPIGVSAICPGFISNTGMYSSWRSQIKMHSPIFFGESSPQKIASSVVDAIENNRSETIVNPVPVKPMLMLLTLFPSLLEWVGRTFGMIRELKKVSDSRKNQLKNS